ncbi:hypothetical protein BC831DRAFT_472405 [Entophlyctis helioformis]|nr:hypothetical protein BC831DRAFT_472405 [Entophlyctis helioformis]
MSAVERNLLALTTGLALTLMAYSIWENMLESAYLRKKTVEIKKRPLPKAEDSLGLDALAELSRSGNLLLQDSALQILLDRALSEEHLPYIIDTCRSTDDPHLLKISVHAIQQLAQEHDMRPMPCPASSATTVSRQQPCLRQRSNADLCVADENKVKIVRYGVLNPIVQSLSYNPRLNSDLKYWSMLVLHQLAMHDDLQPILVAHGVITLLAHLSRLTFGNTNMQRLCLHALVRLIASLPAEISPVYLSQLHEMKMVAMIASCLGQDDVELVSWAVFLMHEFAVKGIFRTLKVCLVNPNVVLARITLRIMACLCQGNEKFQQDAQRGKLIPAIIAAIKSDDTETPYWAVATVLHSCHPPAPAQQDVLNANGIDALADVAGRAPNHLLLYIADILLTLVSNQSHEDQVAQSSAADIAIDFCKSTDTDVQSAGATLLTTMAYSADMRHKVASKQGLEILTLIVRNSDVQANRIIAAKGLVTYAVKDPLLRFQITSLSLRPLMQQLPFKVAECVECLFPGHVDDQLPASRSPRSPEFGSPIVASFSAHVSALASPRGVSSPAMSPMMESPLDGGSPVLGRAGTTARPPLAARPNPPSFLRIMQVCNEVHGLVSGLDILFGTDVFDDVDEADGEQPFREVAADALNETCSSLLDLIALPLVDGSIEAAMAASAVGESPLSVNLVMPTSRPSASAPGSATLQTSPRTDEHPAGGSTGLTVDVGRSAASDELGSSSVEHVHEQLMQSLQSGTYMENPASIADVKANIAVGSLRCIRSLMRYGPVQEMVVREKLVSLLMGLMQSKNKGISYEAFKTLALTVGPGLPIQELLNIPMSFIYILKFAILENSPTLFFYLNLLLERTCRFSRWAFNTPLVFNIMNSVRTPSLTVTRQTQEVRNDSWTFESFRMKTGVSSAGRYAYEFTLRTDGLVQIGWATEDCLLDPEAGDGIGDDVHSYAYDGKRMKKWHAKQFEKESYGTAWASGDTITTLIDLDQCTITYYANGVSLGVAFEDIEPFKTWCPAVSLSSKESGIFRFGGPLDPLLFKPYGAIPVASIPNIGSPTARILDSPMQTLQIARNLMSPYSESPTQQLPSATQEITPMEPRAATTAMETSPVSVAASPETSPALSFYYEVQLSAEGLEYSRQPQVGLLLRDDYMIVIGFISGVHYGDNDIQSLQMDDYLPAYVESLASGSELPAAIDGVNVVHSATDVDWHEGDSMDTLFFTHNGKLIGPEITPEKTAHPMCLPYIRNLPRFVINVFESPFKWKPANADRYCVFTWTAV